MTVSGAGTPERRQLPREACDVRVLVRFARRNVRLGHGPVVKCRTADISEAGLQLVSEVPMPARCPLYLWISITGERKYLLSGEARWRAVVDDGLSFRAGIALDARTDDYGDWCRRFRNGARVFSFPSRES